MKRPDTFAERNMGSLIRIPARWLRGIFITALSHRSLIVELTRRGIHEKYRVIDAFIFRVLPDHRRLATGFVDPHVQPQIKALRSGGAS